MEVAKFFRGPADGQILTLPPEAISSIYVFAEFEPITVEYFYYRAGKLEDLLFAYLYDGYSTI